MENNEKKITMTLDQALEMVIRQLYGIRVPVELIEQIGMPISMAIGHLKGILEAMKAQPAEEQEAAETQDEE